MKKYTVYWRSNLGSGTSTGVLASSPDEAAARVKTTLEVAGHENVVITLTREE